MTPFQFCQKWTQLNAQKLSEKQGYQAHFNDLCTVFSHPKPLEQPHLPGFEPENYTFEKRAAKVGAKGGHGWADVWRNFAFAFEYKKQNLDLEAAYAQLLFYHDDLNNVPVLVTCDFQLLHFRVKRTNCKTVQRIIPLQSFEDEIHQHFMRDVFHNPNQLQIGEPIEKVTQRVAGQLAEIAISLSQENRYGKQPLRVARFLDRVVFTLFAEDCGLLPHQTFKKIVDKGALEAPRVSRQIHALWKAMASGEDFGSEEIRHFNGALFDEVLSEPHPIELHPSEVRALQAAAHQGWEEIDASIFGTLFERALDPTKRAQLGAHYTSRADIETLVDPVIMQPLNDKWNIVRAELESLLKVGNEKAASQKLEAWIEKLGALRTLDPACGSGNFLGVTMQKMLDLEHQARKWGRDYLEFTPRGRVHPRAFFGIEKNIYAHDLAKIALWITYLQWIRNNAYKFHGDPVLESVETIALGDALIDEETGVETEWPEVDFIVGNPPFLGGSKLWNELGRSYQEKLWAIYEKRVPGKADLCCYWFEKAREQIEKGICKRAGLVATQSIRNGANRVVLSRIKETGDIFFAISDRHWILDGANLNISLVAFDNGTQMTRLLDDEVVPIIFSDLTSELDLTQAQPLDENTGICFIGTKKGGAFNLPESEALDLISVPNPHGKPNSDVLRPWRNGSALNQRPEPQWIIDCGTDMAREDFEFYERPYFRVESLVLPERAKNKRTLYKEKWWLHAETRPGMRKAIQPLKRYIATSEVAKHRLFVWVSPEVLCDGSVFTFAREDDFFFGILQSSIHCLWTLRLGMRLEDRPRYTPTTCFGTFPFPRANEEQEEAIAKAAQHLNAMRENWLTPAEWMKEETIEFRASADGHWCQCIVSGSVDSQGVGVAKRTRKVPKNPRLPVTDERFDPRIGQHRIYKVTMADALAHRTLTNLYNSPPSWLQSAHEALDKAVFAAYGWKTDLSEDEILANLLELNLARAQVPTA